MAGATGLEPVKLTMEHSNECSPSPIPLLALLLEIGPHLCETGIRKIVEDETLTPALGEPLDIAYTVAFLASDEAKYITGQNIVVGWRDRGAYPGLRADAVVVCGGGTGAGLEPVS